MFKRNIPRELFLEALKILISPRYSIQEVERMLTYVSEKELSIFRPYTRVLIINDFTGFYSSLVKKYFGYECDVIILTETSKVSSSNRKPVGCNTFKQMNIRGLSAIWKEKISSSHDIIIYGSNPDPDENKAHRNRFLGFIRDTKMSPKTLYFSILGDSLLEEYNLSRDHLNYLTGYWRIYNERKNY